MANKGKHNVVFVATEHDSVYAFDGAAAITEPLWHVNFLDSAKGVGTVPSTDVNCPFILPEIGITSTPVINAKSGTIYVLARTRERRGGNTRYVQKLHALSIADGSEKPGSPVEIHATISSKSHWFSGHIEFDSLRENQRAALLLTHDKVYIAWASSCDVGVYSGWVMAYDANSLAQAGVANISPDAGESGIWQGDAGPAADAEGNVYLITGNGGFTVADGGRDYGDSVVKLRFTQKDSPKPHSFSLAIRLTPFKSVELRTLQNRLRYPLCFLEVCQTKGDTGPSVGKVCENKRDRKTGV